jgi:hypothetical protein
MRDEEPANINEDEHDTQPDQKTKNEIGRCHELRLNRKPGSVAEMSE